jgi:hypothetical protein
LWVILRDESGLTSQFARPGFVPSADSMGLVSEQHKGLENAEVLCTLQFSVSFHHYPRSASNGIKPAQLKTDCIPDFFHSPGLTFVSCRSIHVLLCRAARRCTD